MTKNCLLHVRRSPTDKSKFKRICDVCNQIYLERQLLNPFLRTSQKVKTMISNKDSEQTILTKKLQDLGSVLSEKRRLTVSKPDESSKELVLQQEIKEHEKSIEVLKRELKDLSAKQSRLNDEIFQFDQAYSDKYKLLNET